jgi:hypothetical protein
MPLKDDFVEGDSYTPAHVNAVAVAINTATANSSVAFPTGTVIEILQVGAGQVTLAAGIGVTLNTPSSLLARAQWSTLGLRKRATDSWIVTGDMV